MSYGALGSEQERCERGLALGVRFCGRAGLGGGSGTAGCGFRGETLARPGDFDVFMEGAEQPAAFEAGSELEGEIDGIAHTYLLES